jgi:hypothetical protein
MPLSAQLAKLLTRGARKLMSPVMKHDPLRVLTPEQEAAYYTTSPQSSYGLVPEEQAPIAPVETSITPIETDVVPPVRTEIDELVSPAVPDRPPIRRQVEDLGLSEKEVDELLIPDPIDISKIAEAWKAPYMKARDQGFTVPLYHFTRAGEEIQFDPRGEGTGFLDPLLLKQAGKFNKLHATMDMGIHLGTLSAMGKMNKRLGKKKTKVMGVTLGQEEEQLGQAMLPLVTKLDNVAIIPDMGRFKLPSEWLEELSNLSIELKPNKTIEHILRKDNLEKDFKGNKDNIKNALHSSIETVDDFKKYAKEDGDFVFWPEDGNFVYLKNEKKLRMLAKFVANRFNPLKGMSPTLWKQLMEAAHALHMKNIKLTTKKMDPDAGLFIPESIHPSLIDDWYKALRKILEENNYDAFAYPNYTEDYGAFSYMFLDPKKVKSIFSKKFDPESISFGKAKGGVVDMRSGGRVRMVDGGDTNKIPDVTMELDPKTPGKNIKVAVPEEREFDSSLTNKFWQERYEKEAWKLELEEIYKKRAAKKLADTEKSIGEARKKSKGEESLIAREERKQAGEQLSETEKAFVLASKGNRKALEYMYDYGLHREDRLSQVEAGHKFSEDFSGTFSGQSKDIYVAPRVDVISQSKERFPTWKSRVLDRKRKGEKPLPFIGETWYPDTDSTIQIEQHEFTHAFLDMLKHAVRDEELLSTLSKKDKLKLFKYMDFMQKQLFTPSGERRRSIKGDLIYHGDVEHKVMDQPAKYKAVSVKEGKGYKHPLGGTKPELIVTEDILPPKKDDPTVIGPGEGYDPSVGTGMAKQTTINDIAKSFIRAATKTSASAEIHKRFLKDWRKAGYIFRVPTTEFEEQVKQLQGEEQQEQLQQQQEQFQQQQDSFNQNYGGTASGGQAMDMRNGGVVRM